MKSHWEKLSSLMKYLYPGLYIGTAKSVQVEKTLISPFFPLISLPMHIPGFHKKCSVDMK